MVRRKLDRIVNDDVAFEQGGREDPSNMTSLHDGPLRSPYEKDGRRDCKPGTRRAVGWAPPRVLVAAANLDAGWLRGVAGSRLVQLAVARSM
ncbi:hypothetical protein M8818_002990 [Zalaria obscura]|uniref:Uncharacterized protein n=1 Tax=Zalaria obscura TaxID=2024903 RepID=A0ACC3SFL4_9PEZI